MGGGKKRYLMGIGKKWVDEKKIERKIKSGLSGIRVRRLIYKIKNYN